MNRRVELTEASWRKSSYSNGQGGNCVEIADGFPGIAPVRDSKDPAGPMLIFGAAAWAAFIDQMRATDHAQ